MHALEERLLGMEYLKGETMHAFLEPAFIPTYWAGPFSKHNMIKKFQQFLTDKKVKLREDDGKNLYNQISRMDVESLKRVEFGRKNSEQLSDDLVKRLTDFETAYFLVGVWRKKTASDKSKRFTERSLEKNPLKLTIARTIREGIHFLKYGKAKEYPRMPYSTKVLAKTKQAITTEEIETPIVQDELCDVTTYLRNCDGLKVKPGLVYMFDLEGTHPINY